MPVAMAPQNGDDAMMKATVRFFTAVMRFSTGVYSSVATEAPAIVRRKSAASRPHAMTNAAMYRPAASSMTPSGVKIPLQ